MSTPAHDPLGDRIGANIRELRAARGLTQQQLAKLAGLPRATWQHLESGAANPTVSVLHKVALALQVSVEELISTAARRLPLLCRRLAAGQDAGPGHHRPPVARPHPRRGRSIASSCRRGAPWPASRTPTVRAST